MVGFRFREFQQTMEDNEVGGKTKEGIKMWCQFLVFGEKLKHFIPEYRGTKVLHFFFLIRQRKNIPKYVTCFIILLKISEV
jgi:hypothetical protein